MTFDGTPLRFVPCERQSLSRSPGYLNKEIGSDSGLGFDFRLRLVNVKRPFKNLDQQPSFTIRDGSQARVKFRTDPRRELQGATSASRAASVTPPCPAPCS